MSSFLSGFPPTLLGCGSIWGDIDAPDALSMTCAYPAACLFVLSPCIIPSILWEPFCAVACWASLESWYSERVTWPEKKKTNQLRCLCDLSNSSAIPRGEMLRQEKTLVGGGRKQGIMAMEERFMLSQLLRDAENPARPREPIPLWIYRGRIQHPDASVRGESKAAPQCGWAEPLMG